MSDSTRLSPEALEEIRTHKSYETNKVMHHLCNAYQQSPGGPRDEHIDALDWHLAVLKKETDDLLAHISAIEADLKASESELIDRIAVVVGEREALHDAAERDEIMYGLLEKALFEAREQRNELAEVWVKGPVSDSHLKETVKAARSYLKQGRADDQAGD